MTISAEQALYEFLDTYVAQSPKVQAARDAGESREAIIEAIEEMLPDWIEPISVAIHDCIVADWEDPA